MQYWLCQYSIPSAGEERRENGIQRRSYGLNLAVCGHRWYQRLHDLEGAEGRGFGGGRGDVDAQRDVL